MRPATHLQEALQLCEQILVRQRNAGKETVSISTASLKLLGQLPAEIRTAKSAWNSPAVSAAAAPTQPTAESADSTPSEIKDKDHPYGELARATEQRGRVEIIFPAGDTVRERLNNLFRIAKTCEVCRGLDTLRDQVVFATGNPEADLMFVGEAPGAEEEKQKQPFVGPAGQKLNQIIQAMGLNREDVYISNIVKFRPKIGDGRFQGAKNRKPTPHEMSVSVKIVRSEIEVIEPKVIVALGATAAEGLLESSGPLSSMRGRFHEVDGVPVAVTYHPSYLLRVEGDADAGRARREKRKVWEDALMVMEKLGLPVSDQQRGFFTK